MKKTNNFKRFAAITSASLLAACAMAPAALNSFAADPPTYKITINNPKEGHTYEAYQIFTGDLSIEGEAKILSNIKWGSDVTEYDGNPVSGGTDATDVAKSLTDATIDQFIKDLTFDGSASGSDNAPSDGAYVIDGLVPGYYLIKDANGSLDEDAYDAYTNYIVEVVGDATAAPKTSLPTVEKKVKEDQDTNKASTNATYETDTLWNDVADYDIGDAVPFKLYGTMPQSYFDKYESYYYKFTDTLDSQFDQPSEVIVNIANTKLEFTKDGTGYTGTDGNCSVNYNAGVLTVEFKDIKKYEGVTKDTIVTVEYSAVLNKSANVGLTGQKNKVYLTYSNNPNQEYTPWDGPVETPETGKTPEDDVIVHTYAVQLNKTFFNTDSQIDLTDEELQKGVYDDARFTLSVEGSATPLKFSKLEGDANFDYVLDENGTITQLELTKVVDGEGKNQLVIRIKGLDEGSYTLKEVVVPTGFNKAPDQTVELIADTNNGQGGTAASINTFSWTINGGNEIAGSKDNTTASLEMQNKKGSSLPSTGGIGTTLFYLGGGAMVGIAGVYLISKKRMKNNEQ